MPSYTEDDKKRFLLVLKKHLGVISPACEEFGINRQTFYNWSNDQWFKDAVHIIKEDTIDFVETQLFKQIKRQNPILLKWYLATIGKSRGYVERQEIKQEVDINKITFEFVGGNDE